MHLSPGDIHVWKYEVSIVDYFNEQIDSILSDEETARAARFINEYDKIRYVAVHRFLRKVLARYLSVEPSDIRFVNGAYGKPFVENDRGIYFNLSYRGNHALVAVSNSVDPGIDIEQIRHIDDPKTFCINYFSKKETDIILGAKGTERVNLIFTFWAFKEAVIKSLGIGFKRDLTEYDLSLFLLQPNQPLAVNEGKIWTIQQLEAPEGYKTAVAVKGEGFKIVNYL